MDFVFDLELERVRLRAEIAALRMSASDLETRQRVINELAALESVLLELRPKSRGYHRLHELGLGSDEVDLLWTAVAVTLDQRVVPTALRTAERGLTLATHRLIADIPRNRARALDERVHGESALGD